MKNSNNKSQDTQQTNNKEAVNSEQADVTSNSTTTADNQVVELTADIKRLQAEFVNYKNRVEHEKAVLFSLSKASVVKDLLPVIDDLERALSHMPKNLANDKWAQGVKKVHSRLISQLNKMGVSKIEAEGQMFDHNLHEAVAVEGEGDTQVVAEVIQNGYMLGDQVIRHAAVKVVNK